MQSFCTDASNYLLFLLRRLRLKHKFQMIPMCKEVVYIKPFPENAFFSIYIILPNVSVETKRCVKWHCCVTGGRNSRYCSLHEVRRTCRTSPAKIENVRRRAPVNQMSGKEVEMSGEAKKTSCTLLSCNSDAQFRPMCDSNSDSRLIQKSDSNSDSDPGP